LAKSFSRIQESKIVCSAGQQTSSACWLFYITVEQVRQFFSHALQALLQAGSAGNYSDMQGRLICSAGNPSDTQCRQSFRHAVQAILQAGSASNPSGRQCRQLFRHAGQANLQCRQSFRHAVQAIL
jgi:hypothetical protein